LQLHVKKTNKSDLRLSRNLLKGQIGDEINVLMTACAWNLRKWLVIATIFLFWQKLGLLWSLPLAMTYTSGSCNE
jgi:IS5 family transposase